MATRFGSRAPVNDEGEFVEAAIRSEIDYFCLGAEVEHGSDWLVAQMPGLPDLPSANFCFWDPAPSGSSAINSTLPKIEAVFRDEGTRLVRIYTREPPQQLSAVMRQAGFQMRRETIHLLKRDRALGIEHIHLTERLIRSERDWRDKRDLHGTAAHHSDGHQATARDWIACEARKAATGDVDFILFELDGAVVATGGLMKKIDGAARLKNLYVHPDYRRGGVGRSASGLLSQRAIRLHDCPVVTFAVDGSSGQKLYEAVGFTEIGCLFEWSRQNR